VLNKSGILPSQAIEALLAAGRLRASEPVRPGQIQPASIDLRLARRVYRVRASFLPGPDRTVEERLDKLRLHEIDMSKGAVLETGAVYVAELMESLDLLPGIFAAANPKSSTGRLDVFTRVITDRATCFDQIEPGYSGPLYLEISPRTFPILVRTGSTLSQMRFRVGEARVDDRELAQLQAAETLVTAGDASIQSGIAVSVDLNGFGVSGLVGYRAKRYTGLVDVDQVSGYDVLDFWEPLFVRSGRRDLILDPGQFYILASKESVLVPPDYAAEMVPFDPLVGEFRVHYAGFFDPGFGHRAAGAESARAVLEVRSRDVPFILEHGQTVGRLVYERMSERPARLYGASGQGSNYQGQGLKLSKHFRQGV
jgi:dCTP deaminase